MKSTAIVLATFVVGALLGAVAIGAVVIPQSAEQTQPTVTVQTVTAGETGVNRSGQTYGPAGSDGFESAPDLFEAYATNGLIGYIYTEEFLIATAPAGSLKEALSGQPDERVLTVFARDGETAIGEFVIGSGVAQGSEK